MTINVFLPQVTRIPITGPAPYNTLVCVSVETYLGPQELREGKLSRFPMQVATPFRLAGFDQRIPPIFDHSTTAWINAIGPMENGSWIYAVDSVTGAGFTPTDGTYYLNLMAACSPDGSAPGTCMVFGEGIGICFYFVRIQVTSWVLCYEPPIVPLPQGHIHRLNDLVQQGISSADLTRTPTGSPVQMAAIEHTRQILQQFRIPISISVSGVGNGSSSAPKTVLVTNLDQPNRATTIVPSDAGWAAQSFVTDDSDYGLESIEIIAGNLVGTPSIIAELRGGDATSLGATVATFTVPDLTTDDPQNVKLTPNNPVQLSPNTTYWLVLGTSGDGTFGWTYTEGNEQAGSGTLAQYAYSEDQGVTWNTNSQDSNFYKLEVLVHPVPA